MTQLQFRNHVNILNTEQTKSKLKVKSNLEIFKTKQMNLTIYQTGKANKMKNMNLRNQMRLNEKSRIYLHKS